jgi:hypothetical protein
MNIKTYEVEGQWVMSQDEVWLPGSYDTEQTARDAVELVDEQGFDEFQHRINHVSRENRAITAADLMMFRRIMRTRAPKSHPGLDIPCLCGMIRTEPGCPIHDPGPDPITK